MATYYISPTGDNANDGSIGSPWATLAFAYDNSAAGDTLHLTAGTHVWVSDILTNRTIQGDGAATTILDAGGYSATNTFTAVWACNGLTINDITFQNNGKATYSQGKGAFNASGSGSMAVFNRCIFHTMRVADAALADEINNASGIFSGSTSGITLTLNSCVFYNIRRNPTASSRGCIFGFGNLGSGTGTVNNCTFDFSVASPDNLTSIQQQAWTNTYKNCIIRNASGSAFALGGVATSTSHFIFCDLYLTTDLGQHGTNVVTKTDCITSDPQMVDPANGDFRLRQSSPCLDAGTII